MENIKEEKFSQHRKRVIIIEIVYQYFLEQENEKILDDYLLSEENNLTDEIVKIIKDIFWYKDTLKAKISENLKVNWSFESLKPIEKAILFLATYEIVYTGTNKPIIINEAVIIAKQYASSNAYKYINGVLDKIKK